MFEESQGVLCMVLVQIFATGMQLLSKVVLSDGTFIFALMAYRHVVAAICVAPFAFFYERKTCKKLNWSVMCWLLVNASTGITLAMGLYYYGLRDTTAAYATNFLNLIPIATFFFSVVIGYEKLGIMETKAGKVKVAGAILCVGGALVVTLYKGSTFHIGHHHHHHHHHHHPSLDHRRMKLTIVEHNWTRGTCMLVGSCLSYAIWFIVQVKLRKVFPSKYTMTMLTCIIASAQSGMIGLCIDRRVSTWKLGWNLQLLTIFYSGAFATAASFCLISWAVTNRGPAYAPMFNPLALIFVVFLEALLLGEKLSVGSLIGMCLIIVGIYSYLWGRKQEPAKILSSPNIAVIDEVATKAPELANYSSTTVMPANLVPSDVDIHIEQDGSKITGELRVDRS